MMAESKTADLAEVAPEILKDLMKFSIDRDEWDESPMLFIILNPDPAIPNAGHKHRVVLLALPPVMWSLAHPAEIIEKMGHAALHHPEVDMPNIGIDVGDDVLGTILFTEGWAFDSTQGITPEEAMAWTNAGKSIVDHPAAVEVKVFTAVTVDDIYIITHQRHADEPIIMSGHERLDGRVPDALKVLLDGLRLRYTMPGR